MDMGWHFAFGNATDPAKDFDPVPGGNNNYFAKAGNARARRPRILTTVPGAQ